MIPATRGANAGRRRAWSWPARPAAALVVLMALAVGLSASAARADEIRDVRPTTLAAGETLVIECPGVQPGVPATVRLRGHRAPGPGDLEYLGGARASRGDRVLLELPPAQATRLEDVRIEVKQGSHTWSLPPGFALALEIAPPSLARTAETIAHAVAPGPGFAHALLVFAVVFLLGLGIHLLVAPVTGIILIWERKIWGRMQSRVGPNRVGPNGWLQWLADGVKMLLKEDIIPTEADGPLFRLAPYLMWMSVFATFVALPLSATAVVADLNVGLLYLASITSLTVIAILLGGWTSNSKWSLLGGMRSAAQIVSYELPGTLSLLQVALLAGSLSPQAIVRAQGGLPHQWFAFANPFAFASMFIYFIAGLAEGNRTPFDLPEADSELVAGYTTEYSGFRYGIFYLAEWTNVYVLSAIIATTLLGGWNVPFVAADVVATHAPLELLGALVLLAKVAALVFVIIWVRATLPRYRLDQLMALCWKYLVPISFVCFMATATWLWIAGRWPLLGTLMRAGTFLVCGLGLLAFFTARVLASFRGSRLLDRHAP